MPTTDQLEAIRILLGIGLVLANVAVWYGVYLERDTAPQAVQARGWRILVRALATEAALAFILLAVDTTIGVRQRSEILKLETEIAPRRLTTEQQQEIAGAVFGNSSSVIRVESYSLDAESAILGSQIEFALSGVQVDDRLMSQVSLGQIAFGIHVTGRDKKLVGILLKAFSNVGLKVSPKPASSGGTALISGGGAPDSAIDATVFVGVKPIAQ